MWFLCVVVKCLIGLEWCDFRFCDLIYFLGDGIFIDVIKEIGIGFSFFVNGVVWVDID